MKYTAEEVLPILERFHREVFLPDFRRIIGEFEAWMNARFAEIGRRFAEFDEHFDRPEAQPPDPRGS